MQFHASLTQLLGNIIAKSYFNVNVRVPFFKCMKVKRKLEKGHIGNNRSHHSNTKS